jgi:hypothetical protein
LLETPANSARLLSTGASVKSLQNAIICARAEPVEQIVPSRFPLGHAVICPSVNGLCSPQRLDGYNLIMSG